MPAQARRLFTALLDVPLLSDPGLMGWWPFDFGSSTDLSGNQNNGIFVGSPTFTDSPVGGSYNCSSGNYLQVTNLGNSNPISTNRITACCWVKINATSRGDLIGIWGGNGGGVSDQFDLLYGLTAGKPQFFVNFSGTLKNSGVGSVAMTTGVWNHVAGVHDGANQTVYLNGAQASTAANTGTIGTGASNPIKIGAAGPNAYSGGIADARLYNRALSLAEINAIYNFGLRTISAEPASLLSSIVVPLFVHHRKMQKIA